jgi:hypothetical protein
MSRTSSSGSRLRFFTADDALEIDHASSSTITANLLSSPISQERLPPFSRKRRRRPSIVNSLENDDCNRARSVIKLEHLGERGGKLICLIQFVAFVISISLISVGYYFSERSLAMEGDRTGKKCDEFYTPASSFSSSYSSTQPPLLSSCMTIISGEDDSSVSTFSSTMTNLGSVLGRIDLHVAFPNGTSYGIDDSTTYAPDGTTIMLNYDLVLAGCGKKPSTKCEEEDWLKVLEITDATTFVNEGEDSLGYSYDHSRFFSVFQNQENIINHGWVSSYKLQVTLYNNTKLLSPDTNQLFFIFGYDDIQTLTFEKALRVVFFVLNLSVLLYWLYKNNVSPSTRSDFKMWVEEKKWITFLLVGTVSGEATYTKNLLSTKRDVSPLVATQVLFQNPILIIAQFNEAPSLGLALATKCNQLFAFGVLSWVFLLFSDGMAFHSKTPFQFYFPKTLLILVYLCATLSFELLSAPIFVSTKSRSPLLSTYNWSKDLR